MEVEVRRLIVNPWMLTLELWRHALEPCPGALPWSHAWRLILVPCSLNLEQHKHHRAVNWSMEADHEGGVAHLEAMEAHSGTVDAHPAVMEACSGVLKLFLKLLRLTLKLWRLTMEPWRLTIEL
jgi:hypothetical protein